MLDPNKTIQFSLKDEREETTRQVLVSVYDALVKKLEKDKRSIAHQLPHKLLCKLFYTQDSKREKEKRLRNLFKHIQLCRQ